MMRRTYRLWFILWVLACCLPTVSADNKPEIGFKAVVAETSFPAFNKTLQGGWGQDVMAHALKQELPHMDITANRYARYFGIVKVPLAEYWQVRFKYPERPVFLVRVYLRLFVYDVETQRELLRETVSAFAAETWDKSGKELAMVPLRKAFQQCVTLAAQKISQKLPLTGRVSKVVSADAGIVEVNLGENSGITRDMRLEILNDKGETMGRFVVTRTYPQQCRAELPDGSAPFLKEGLSVRLVKESREQGFNKLDVLRQALGEDFLGPQETPVVPNPLVEIRITNPNNNHKTYLGRDPGGIALEARGYDAWGDEVPLVNKLLWEVVRGDKGLIPAGSSRFIPRQPGSFDIRAQYPQPGAKPLESSVMIHVIQLKKLTLLPREVVVAGGDNFRFTVSGEDSEGKQLTAGDLQEQLRWSIDGGAATVNDNGIITAGNKGGRFAVKVVARSTPSVADQAEVFVLPPLQLRILDGQGKVVTGSKLVVAPEETVTLRCDMACQEAVDLSRLAVGWQVEQEQAGTCKEDNRILFFRAGTQETTVPFGIGVRVQNVADTSKRRDTEAKVWIEIRQQAFQVRLKPLREAPYFTEEPIHIEAQGVTAQNVVVKDLQFTVNALGSDVQMQDKGGGFYTLTAKQAEQVVVIAREKKSGQEGRLTLVIQKPTGVSRVELTSAKFQREIYPGQTLVLIAKAYRGNKEVDDVQFSWAISPISPRLTVDASGLLTAAANAEGEYEVTARETTSNKEAKLIIRVLPEPVASIQIEAPKSLESGKIYPLSAVLKGREGNKLYGRKIAWRVSSNGTVDNEGLFKAKEPGFARVFARVDELEESVVIEILPGMMASKPITVHRIVIKNNDNKNSIAPGETLQFVAQAFDSEDRPLSGVAFQWTVSDNSHKIGPDGFFTAGNKIGSVDIIASEAKSKMSKAFTFSVRWPAVAEIRLTIADKDSAAVFVQESVPLTVSVQGERQEMLRNYTVVWETSGGKVDDKQQFVAPNQPGSYKIVARDQTGKIASNAVFVTVSERAAKVQYDRLQVDVQREVVNPGEETRLRARARDSQNRWSYDIQVKWKIGHAGGHTIKPDGTFRAGNQTGVVAITAEFVTPQGRTLTANARITVKRVPALVRIDPTVASLPPGATQNFTAKVYDSQDNLLSDLGVTWETNGGTVKPHDNSCLFTAGQRPGTYEVSARLNEQVTARARVQIIQPEGEFAVRTHFGMTYQVPRAWKEQIKDEQEIKLKACAYLAKDDESAGLIFSYIPWQEGNRWESDPAFAEHMWTIMYGLVENMWLNQAFEGGTFQRVRVDKTTINDLNGRICHYDVQQPDRGPSKVVLFMSVRNDHFYVFLCAARAKEWDIYWPTFQTSLNSWRMTGDTSPTAQQQPPTQTPARAALRFKKVQFFEGGNTPPALKDRQLATRFARDKTRYIYYHVSADNLLYNKQSHIVQIVGKFYRPDGSLFGQAKVSPNVQAGWADMNAWSGFGWVKTGNWPTGTYRVEIFFGDDKVGEGRFTIYDQEQTLVFKELKFFESGDKAPPIPQQKYATRFARQQTRFVYFAVVAQNLLYNRQNQRANVTGKFYRPDGSLMGEPKSTPELSSAWPEVTVWAGWGWQQAGNWPAGSYRVEIFFGSEKVGEGRFAIDDGTRHDATAQQQATPRQTPETQPPATDDGWKTVAEPDYRASYRVAENWVSKEIDSISGEKVVQYWRPDGAFIQFGLWRFAGESIEDTRKTMEEVYLAAWGAYRATGTRNIKVGHGSAKVVSYQIRSNDGHEVYAEALYGSYQQTVYMVFFCGLSAMAQQFRPDFVKSMQSLRVSKNESDEENGNEED